MLKRRGFTLIEMLVALAIFSMLLAMLMIGFSQGMILWKKGHKLTVESQKLLMLHDVLSQIFMQAVAAKYHYKSGAVGVYFQGNRNSLKVITAAPILSPMGHVCPIELRWRKAKDGAEMLEYRQAKRGGDPSRGIEIGGEWQSLMSDVKSAFFLFEAPVFDPMGLLKNKLVSKRDVLYRLKPMMLKRYDGLKLKVMPRRVLLFFKDSKGNEHRWFFNLRTSSSVFSESMYHAY